MRWVYDIENCIRYEYPNEPHGPERPSNPPTPPAGWSVPRVGDVIGVDTDPSGEPLKVRVIGVEWDYAVPRVTVQLEVVHDQPDEIEGAWQFRDWETVRRLQDERESEQP